MRIRVNPCDSERIRDEGVSGALGTAVFFHAHPDDECILTGGTMAKLAAEGHRVVLVTA
ncbi:MAG: hypothetical protein QOJ52_3042, partial [Acidimicrobiaceae bacterium]|nr:hypothetical protein [Acidimicrobiaceae bacterium]